MLVLDEATSSIDTATEALIQEALERILRTRTSVVIAHRLSTIRNADRIIVMHRGVIVEDGTHTALLARQGYYARLHRHQLAGQQPSDADKVVAGKTMVATGRTEGFSLCYNRAMTCVVWKGAHTWRHLPTTRPGLPARPFAALLASGIFPPRATGPLFDSPPFG